MKTSERGLALIKRHEGLRLSAYLCPAGVWTIGYGHTSAAGSPVVKPGQTITKDEANAILAQDLSQYETAVSTAVKRPLTQGQFDALVSLCFNIGVGAFRKSTLVGAINAGKLENAPAQFMRWTRAGGRELPGLVKRRRDEVALWRSLDDAEPDGEETRTTPQPPADKPLSQSKTLWSQITGGIAAAVGTLTPVVALIKEIEWEKVAVIATVALVALGIAWASNAFAIRERVRKMREEGV